MGYYQANPKGIEGIKFNFNGKDLHDTLMVQNLDGKTIKKIKIEWDGIPTGNGSSKSIALIILKPHQEYTSTINNLIQGKDGAGDAPYYNNYTDLYDSNKYLDVVYALGVPGTATNLEYMRGTADAYDTSKFKNLDDWHQNGHCSTGEIELPAACQNGDFDLFIGWIGANASSAPTWIADNFNVTIVEYK